MTLRARVGQLDHRRERTFTPGSQAHNDTFRSEANERKLTKDTTKRRKKRAVDVKQPSNLTSITSKEGTVNHAVDVLVKRRAHGDRKHERHTHYAPGAVAAPIPQQTLSERGRRYPRPDDVTPSWT